MHERQLGNEAEIRARAELAAEERLRVLEGLHRLAGSLLVAKDAHVDFRTSQVIGDLHRGDGGKGDARVAQLLADERAELALQQGVHPVGSLIRHG